MPTSGRRERVDASGLSPSSSRGRPDVDDAAGVEHDGIAARPAATTPRFCSTSSTVVSSDDALERGATSVTSSGASPFVGSSIEQQAVVVQQRAADRDHLLLAARERAGRLLAARPQLGEELVDELVARLARPARRGAGSRRPSAPEKTSRSSGT